MGMLKKLDKTGRLNWIDSLSLFLLSVFSLLYCFFWTGFALNGLASSGLKGRVAWVLREGEQRNCKCFMLVLRRWLEAIHTHIRDCIYHASSILRSQILKRKHNKRST